MRCGGKRRVVAVRMVLIGGGRQDGGAQVGTSSVRR